MSKVSVSLNGRAFTIGCEEGQESYLRELAAHLDERVRGMSQQVGQIGDLRLLLMASLVVVDELREAERRAEGLEAHVDRLRGETAETASVRAEERDEIAAHLVAAAERLEGLARALEQAEPAPVDVQNGAEPETSTVQNTLFAEAGA